MKKTLIYLIIAYFSTLIAGCAATLPAVQNEFPISRSKITINPTDNNLTRLVIFNSAIVIIHPITGRLNIYLNGKGVAQLGIGEYIQTLVPRGSYNVTLLHHDLFPFSSSHRIEITGTEAYLEVYPTILSNAARLVKDLPDEFEERYTTKY